MIHISIYNEPFCTLHLHYNTGGLPSYAKDFLPEVVFYTYNKVCNGSKGKILFYSPWGQGKKSFNFKSPKMKRP